MRSSILFLHYLIKKALHDQKTAAEWSYEIYMHIYLFFDKLDKSRNTGKILMHRIYTVVIII